MSVAAIILCGGQSSRMGRPKAWLPIGQETLLQRIVRLVATTADPVVVVAAPGQELPTLPQAIRRVDDREPGLGPLEGFASGLESLSCDITHVYLTSTDAPFLVPAWIQRLTELITEDDVAVPIQNGHPQPLAALFRRESVLLIIQTLIKDRRLSLRGLLEALNVKKIEADAFRDIDPDLLTLRNINTHEEYIKLLNEQY